MNVIDGLPESFEISPIRTHGLHAEDIHKQIQYKLESLGEKIEVIFYQDSFTHLRTIYIIDTTQS